MENILRSVYDWIEFINPGKGVRLAPVLSGRPSDDYLTYQLINVLPQFHGFKYEETGKRYTNAEMIFSVNAYSPQGAAMLYNMQQSGDWWDAKQKLLGHGEEIAFVSATAPNNLTALGDESWRSRWQADFTFSTTITQDRTFYGISQWLLTGELVTADGVDIVRTSVEWP